MIIGIAVEEPYDAGVTAVSSRSIVISLSLTVVEIPVSPVKVTVDAAETSSVLPVSAAMLRSAAEPPN